MGWGCRRARVGGNLPFGWQRPQPQCPLSSRSLHPIPFPPGMPDFLEKLHTAALKAKKLELEVRDYLSAKGLEGSEGKAPAAEHKGEGSRSPAQLEYA